jgi:HSP20 family molecular chaperone IbpA
MDRLEATLEDNPEVESWPIPLDVVHEDDEIVVHASMPGVDPENIEVLLLIPEETTNRTQVV